MVGVEKGIMNLGTRVSRSDQKVPYLVQDSENYYGSEEEYYISWVFNVTTVRSP